MQTPQLYNPQLPTGFLVVLLTALSVHGEHVPADTILEVERAVRNDWIGSGFCRDATDEEIAEYRGEQLAVDQVDADLQALTEQKRDLALEVDSLQARKAELSGDLAALESDLDSFSKQRDALQGEVDDLTGKQKKLADEVAALEKKKAAGK